MTHLDVNKLSINLWVAGSTDQEGNGGWCSHLHCVINGHHHTNITGGYDKSTTPTRMSLQGVLNGLRLLKREVPVFVNIYTSVVQVSTGLNQNMYKWAERNWLTSKGEAPQHLDLWQQIHEILTDTSRVMAYKVILQNQDNMNHPNRLVAIHHAAEYLEKGKVEMDQYTYA